MKNDITIHGYIGRDPELETIQGMNGPFNKTTFSVGVSRDFGDETDWFRCEIIGKRAEVVEKWFRKGSQIIVSGRMESYTPKNDQNRKSWVLKVRDFDFCDKKVNTDGSSAEPNDPEGFGPMNEDEMPF